MRFLVKLRFGLDVLFDHGEQGEDKEQESCSYTPVELYAEKSLVCIVVSSTRGQLAGFHSLGKKSYLAAHSDGH